MDKRVTLTIEIFDPDKKAARAAQKAILEEIYLVDAKTWRKPGVISSEVLALQHKCSTEILLPTPKGYKERLDLYFILCKFQVAAFKDKSPNKPTMKIEATFCTSFSLNHADPDGPNRLDLELDFEGSYSAFTNHIYKINPISTAWPYWRELVQNMSTRMGYPALIVPMLEIVIKEPEDKAKDNVA
ncbi:MAG: hypothetical protein C4567_11995 [Deltaproteobacteria bacterium]|nr:MAG: hypothetical protein C4567_11995 [Deltaproteobacteria bacterium]